MGTEGGALHVLAMEEKDKRERLWAPLLELDAPTPAVRGCYQQVGETPLCKRSCRSHADTA